MQVRKFNLADASLERSPGQDADVFAGNVVDQRRRADHHRLRALGPGQGIEERLTVDDVMVILEGRLSVTSASGSFTADPTEAS